MIRAKLGYCILICIIASPLTHQNPVSIVQEDSFRYQTDGINWNSSIIQLTSDKCRDVKRSRHYYNNGEEYLDDFDLAKIEVFKESRTFGQWHHLRIWMQRCLNEFNAPQQAVNDIVGETGNIIYVHIVGYNQLHELEETLKTLKANQELYEFYLKSQQEFLNNHQNDMSLKISYVLCKCVRNETNEFLSEQVSLLPTTYSYIENMIIYVRYIEPLLLLITFGIGITLNVTLLYIFVKHEELRSLPNIMVLNLAVNDFIGLVIMLPIQYALRCYDVTNIRMVDVMTMLMFVVLSFVSVISISVLSVQRYMAVSSINNNVVSKQGISDKWKKVLYMLGVWLSSSLVLVIILADAVSNAMNQKGVSTYTLGATLILFTVVLPLLVTVFNILTSRKLAKSAKRIPGEHRNIQSLIRNRILSSRIVAGLIIVFWFTHTPFFGSMCLQLGCIWMDKIGVDHKDFHVFDLVWLYIISGYHILYFSNATFNSLALYYGSNKFKQMYDKYLFGRLSFGNKGIEVLK